MPLSLADGAAELTDQFATLPASNPASPFYQPPPGYYQDNNGNLVSNGTPSHTFATPSGVSTSTASTGLGSDGSLLGGIQDARKSLLPLVTSVAGVGVSVDNYLSKKIFGIGLEDFIFIAIGIILISAGLFSFKQAQTVINTGARAVKGAASIAAE